MDKIQINPEKIYDLVIGYLPKLALALITLVIGLWLIRLFGKFLTRVLKSRDFDETLIPFIKSLSKIILTVMLLISVMGMIGVEMTSFIALLGAAGLALGMALSGSLQHFAGGILLLIYKPFKKGDIIKVQDIKGIVRGIGIFNTIVNTFDNRIVYIPNGPLSNGVIVNYTSEDKRRVDLTFSISYTDNIEKAKSIIKTIIENDDRIFKDPAPIIGVSALASSSVDIDVKVWVNTPNVFEVTFFLNEEVKNRFDKNGITIPFPQMDVNLKK